MCYHYPMSWKSNSICKYNASVKVILWQAVWMLCYNAFDLYRRLQFLLSNHLVWDARGEASLARDTGSACVLTASRNIYIYICAQGRPLHLPFFCTACEVLKVVVTRLFQVHLATPSGGPFRKVTTTTSQSGTGGKGQQH